MPDCQQSARTAGGSIIGQATAGYRPGERSPEPPIMDVRQLDRYQADAHAGRRLHTRLVAAQRPPSVASCDRCREEDRPLCRLFRQRPGSMQQAARGFACVGLWVGHLHGMDAGRHRVHRLCVAVDVHYLESGGVPAAAVVAADAAFSQAQVPQAGRGGAVVTGGHERAEAARLGWSHVQVGLAGGVAPVMPEVLATPGLPDFNQVPGLTCRACLGWAGADGDLPAVRSTPTARLGGWPGIR